MHCHQGACSHSDLYSCSMTNPSNRLFVESGQTVLRFLHPQPEGQQELSLQVRRLCCLCRQVQLESLCCCWRGFQQLAPALAGLPELGSWLGVQAHLQQEKCM